ncbi:MAG: hypothetical protein AB7I59_07320 [Geminicoccaceae bacterium]
MRAGYCLVVVSALAAGGLALAGPADAHHNDWAAPLVGGALGGYALGSLVSNSEKPQTQTVYEQPAPVYYTPAPPPPPAYVPMTSTATIEAQLNQLDRLAAGGYITPAEYQARRKAILGET